MSHEPPFGAARCRSGLVDGAGSVNGGISARGLRGRKVARMFRERSVPRRQVGVPRRLWTPVPGTPTVGGLATTGTSTCRRGRNSTRRGPPDGGPLAWFMSPCALASQLGADAAEELPHAGAPAATLRARGHWHRAGVRSRRHPAGAPRTRGRAQRTAVRMGLREVVGVVARRQLICERGEGDDQVGGTPDGIAQGALDRPGICGRGEHVFAKLEPSSDGWRQNACSRRNLREFWLYSGKVRSLRCMRTCS